VVAPNSIAGLTDVHTNMCSSLKAGMTTAKRATDHLKVQQEAERCRCPGRASTTTRNARAMLLPARRIIGLYEGCKPLVCQDSILLAFYLQQSDHAPIQLSALLKAPIAGVCVMAPVAISYAVRPSE